MPKVKTSNLDANLPPRITEWTAPTGRKLVPGTEFKVKGQRGKFSFVAFIDHPKEPYVEASKAGKIRCIRPNSIHGVSNSKGGPK